MKKHWMMLGLSVCMLVTLELEAIGRRGGGPSRGGSINRSPSINRSRPQSQARPARSRSSLPSQSTVRKNPTRPLERNAGKRATNRSIEDFLGDKQKRPATLPERTLDDRFGDRQVRTDRPIQRLDERPADRWADQGNRIREYPHDRVYDHFHDDHWWRRAGWTAAIGWAGWNWRTPYYYGYTNDGDWGYYDEAEYSGDLYEPTYEEQSQTISSVANAEEVADEDWLPLGMFALTIPEDSSTPPSGYMQLSLSKDGQLSGYYYNSTMNQSYKLTGKVDRETQIAAWQKVDSENSPIIETGIFNLTQEEAPARLHFADGRSQNILLIAIENDKK